MIARAAALAMLLVAGCMRPQCPTASLPPGVDCSQLYAQASMGQPFTAEQHAWYTSCYNADYCDGAGGGSSYAPSGDGRVHVRGYHRRDGTYVRPHTRSRPRR